MPALLRLTATALAVLAPSIVGVQELAWSPAEGSTIDRRFRLDAVLMQETGTMSFDGNEQEFEGGIARWLRREVRVSDELRSVGDGRPLTLARRFDALAQSAGVGEEIEEDGHHVISSSSELEDTTVVFSWDADGEEYARAFDEESAGDAERLEGLREDMDLRGFLPRDAVDHGESWSVEPEALAALLVAGGALGFGDAVPEDVPGEGPKGAMLITLPEAPRDLSVWFAGLEGEVEATLDELREQDGVRVAVIALAFQVEASQDLTEVEAALDGGEVEYDRADFELALEGKGELWWDLERGVFHTVELDGQLEATLTADWALEHGPVTLQIGVELPFEGTLRLEATTLDLD